MEYLKRGNTLIVRLQKGDELVSSLLSLIEREKVTCGRVSGIGATDNVTIGVFNPKTKVYTKVNVTDDMEILSISGNLTRKDGAPYVHVRGSFASLEKVYGGLVNECVTSATAELIIDLYDVEVERKFDEETGLNLLKL